MIQPLYLTADHIATWTGGGSVTDNEKIALEVWGHLRLNRHLERYAKNGQEAPVVISGKELEVQAQEDPFAIDARARTLVDRLVKASGPPELVHLYAGCFSETVKFLKAQGAKVCYTAAAHDRRISIEEFKRLGYAYPYKHIEDDSLFGRYVEGYKLADIIVVPSALSARVMESYGCDKEKIRVIPHGVRPPEYAPEFPTTRVAVGYLGAVGPDKGLIYLLQGWKLFTENAGYPPEAQLILAGPHDDTMLQMARQVGGGNIFIAGFVEDKTQDFFEKINIYCQPSVSEGFGLEVLEAYAHGRPVIVTEGVGAKDCALFDSWTHGQLVPIRNPHAIAEAIMTAYRGWKQISNWREVQTQLCDHTSNYSWNIIQQKYMDVWEGLCQKT